MQFKKYIYRQKHGWIVYLVHIPYKHTTWILRWNDVETVVSTSFQRGIQAVCL